MFKHAPSLTRHSLGMTSRFRLGLMSNQPSRHSLNISLFQSFRLNSTETFPILLVPAEGNAPSLAHLGQAVGLRLTLEIERSALEEVRCANIEVLLR